MPIRITKIQFRRDVLADWQAKNPVLDDGEPAYIIDTKDFKIGDGLTKFNDLPVANDASVDWGGVGGTLSDQTDLQNALNGKEDSFSKNSAFNKDFGTTSGTITQGNDSRLSDARTPITHGDDAHSETYIKDGDVRLADSREWIADTVSQLEAETRTSTTRRAWTAQRVGQAIVAWWNTITLTISNISGLQTELDEKVTAVPGQGLSDENYTLAEKNKVANVPADTNSELATKADLVGGTVPSSQLPAFVDDVLEFVNLAAFPATGEDGKIYVAEDTNITYRWSGSAYVEISSSLALGETSSTAYRGDRGKTAYDHSQVATGNPHGVTKAEVGLSNVPNVDATNASNLSSGSIPNARVPSSNVTQHQSALTITESQISDLGTYENAFTKNSAFNKNFGTTTGTVAQGNDSRINNGQTAFGWGDHSSAGYANLTGENTFTGNQIFNDGISFDGGTTILDGSNIANLDVNNLFSGTQRISGTAPSWDFIETDETDLNVKNILNASRFDWHLRDDANGFLGTIFRFDLGATVIENKWKAHFDNGISFDGGTNVLSEYETGTWTPDVKTSGAGISATLSTAQGNYTRIGDVVFIDFDIVSTSLNSGSGAVRIYGIPFAPDATEGGSALSKCGSLNIGVGEIVTARPNFSSYLDLFLWDETGGTSQLASTEFTDTGQLTGSLMYKIA